MVLTLETLRAAFGWCAIINSGVLILWLVMFLLCRDWIYKMHGRLFRISEEKFDAIHYGGMALYKTGIFLFNIAPYLALSIVG